MKWNQSKTKPKTDGQKLICLVDKDMSLFYVNWFQKGKWAPLPYIYSRYRDFTWTDIDLDGGTK